MAETDWMENMKRPLITIFLIAASFGGLVYAQTGPRYFDTAPTKSDSIRLTILDPAEEGILALIELRKEGFLDIQNLVVVGLYHERERANYDRAKAYVRDNKIDWIKFHELSGDIDEGRLFQQNALTADFEAAFRKSDGVVFFGGYDIPPSIYGQKTSILTRILTPCRHFIELSLVYHLLGGSQNAVPAPLLDSRPDFPVLGICLGSQTLNVGTGGTLYQDIWSEIYAKKTVEDVIAIGRDDLHKNPFPLLFPGQRLYSVNLHPIRLVAGGKFTTTLGFGPKDTPVVRCGHHQALARLGKGLKIIATSMDGKVVEGVEHTKYPNVLGVAFHPEDPRLWDPGLRMKFAPQDPQETSLRAVLEDNPPSFAFHKKIWSWLGEKLRTSHSSR
jgi:putative glutamine amidotransferase